MCSVKVKRRKYFGTEGVVLNKSFPRFQQKRNGTSERACSLMVTRALVAPQVLGSTPRGERISQDLTAFVLSVVGDVPVDSEASVVTSSILRICRYSLRRCS
jgi:hypothetical protein